MFICEKHIVTKGGSFKVPESLRWSRISARREEHLNSNEDI